MKFFSMSLTLVEEVAAAAEEMEEEAMVQLQDVL